MAQSDEDVFNPNFGPNEILISESEKLETKQSEQLERESGSLQALTSQKEVRVWKALGIANGRSHTVVEIDFRRIGNLNSNASSSPCAAAVTDRLSNRL